MRDAGALRKSRDEQANRGCCWAMVAHPSLRHRRASCFVVAMPTRHRLMPDTKERQRRGARDRRTRGPHHAPRQALFLARRQALEARPRPLLPVGRRRRARRHPRSPDRAQALRRRRRGRGVLSEARAREAAGLAAHRDAVVSVGAHRRGGRRRRRRRSRVDREPRLHRAASAPGARRRSRSSRRAAHRSRSRARASRGTTCAASRWRCKALLEELGLRGWPKTSGSRGMHVNVRIEPRWTFTEVRRAALALSREIERRAPALATSKWWKEERHGVFLDYNQNAKDRTTCSAYSVRPLPDARVSTPLDVGRGARLRAGRLHGAARCRRASPTIGDPHAGMDDAAGLARGAARARRARRGGGPRRRAVAAALPKMEGEAPRVAPSRAQGRAAKQAAAREDAAHHRREFARARRRRSRARALEGEAPRGRGAPRGRRRARRLDARPLVDLDAHPRQPAQRARRRCARRRRRPIPTTIRPASGASMRRSEKRRDARDVERAQRPVAKIAASSCGGTTSSCA